MEFDLGEIHGMYGPIDAGRSLRVGVPNRLFSKVLARGLDKVALGGLDERPSEALSEAFRKGAYDCALLCPLDALLLENVRIVPGIGACTDGPSTELLASRVELGEIRRLAGTPDTTGSIALARVILAETHGVHPDIRVCDDLRVSDADAVVFSGDMPRESMSGYPVVRDLGEMWRALTDLPFVHALWACPSGAPLTSIKVAVNRAYQQGLAAIPDIARDSAGEWGRGPDEVSSLLTETYRFSVGSAEMDGLRRFVDLAVKHGCCRADAHVVLC